MDLPFAAAPPPSVSWVMSPLAECGRAAAPSEYGGYLVHKVLSTLVSNPSGWAKTVLFIGYDENGGWFDQVPPVTAPQGTADEWLTVIPPPPMASPGRDVTLFRPSPGLAFLGYDRVCSR